jgi:hypothetical protein
MLDFSVLYNSTGMLQGRNRLYTTYLLSDLPFHLLPCRFWKLYGDAQASTDCGKQHDIREVSTYEVIFY